MIQLKNIGGRVAAWRLTRGGGNIAAVRLAATCWWLGKTGLSDLTAFLLTLAALLWLTDMAGRSFSIGPEDLAALRRASRWFKERILSGRGRVAGTPAWIDGALSRD